MSAARDSIRSLLVVALFSRHSEALDWGRERLEPDYGPVVLTSDDFDFHHTSYYAPTMGTGLRKRLLVFAPLFPAERLADVKRHTIGLEQTLSATGQFAEARPLNLDPGLLQLGKFLLATTKDQAHRIYLRDGVFAEVTLRYQNGAYEPWPWTYADYREPDVRQFLNRGRAYLHEQDTALRANVIE